MQQSKATVIYKVKRKSASGTVRYLGVYLTHPAGVPEIDEALEIVENIEVRTTRPYTSQECQFQKPSAGNKTHARSVVKNFI